MQTNEIKREIRKRLRERRDAISAEQAREWNDAIVARIAASEAFQCADTVLLYAPTGSEIDLMPLTLLAWERGIDVAFPVCDTEACTLSFRVLERGAELERGAYGIMTPPPDAREATVTARTLCILPGLAFTPSGARIGYGKGYYDRFLEHFSGVAIGAVYEYMLCKKLPTEAHDRPVSAVFTERGEIRCHALERKPDEEKNASQALVERIRAWGRTRTLRKRPIAKQTEAEDRPVRALHFPIALALCVFLLLVAARVVDTVFLTRDSEALGVILLQVLVFVVPAVGYSALRGERFFERIRLSMPRLEHLWFCVCALAVMIFGSLATSILTGGMESLTGGFVLYNTFTAQSDGSFLGVAAVVLTYAIVPAFCEELVFRDYLCAECEHLGVGISVAVSAILFAMLHFSFPLFLTYFFLGAILAVVLYVTRSFFAVLALHVLYNLFCLFGQPYLTAFYLTAGSNDIFIFCVVVLFLLFAAFAAGEARKIYHVYAKRNLSSAYTEPRTLRSYPKTLMRAVATPFFVACVIVWILMSLSSLHI